MIADYNAARQEIVAIFLIIEIMTKIKLYIVLLFLLDCSKPTVRIINSKRQVLAF
jgi:hypothetical protein